MSAETKQALVDAITAHLHDEDEAAPIVTGLLLIASVASLQAGTTGYRFEVLSDDQPAHVTRGLSSLVTEWAIDATSLHMWDVEDD